MHCIIFVNLYSATHGATLIGDAPSETKPLRIEEEEENEEGEENRASGL